MKVEFVNPFMEASTAMIEAIMGQPPFRGELGIRPQVFTNHQVNIVSGITGDIEGQVIYGMSVITADRIASKLCGERVVAFDHTAATAIANFGKQINDRSAASLAEIPLRVRIAPPTIVKGTNVKISANSAPALVIPLAVEEAGAIEVIVSLHERVLRIAA